MLFVLAGVVLLVFLLWMGLQIRPGPFPAYPDTTHITSFVPLPDDLPEPVRRFYQVACEGDLPVITSAVITLSGIIRLGPVPFKGRLRFTHDAGKGYRHYIEATLFGIPVFKVNERYLDQRGVMELPFATIDDAPKINMAANLGLWGETMWLHPVFITDQRVRWEAIDRHTARLIVPFEDDQEDSFTVRFDEQTGLIQSMEAMRYREANSTEKTGWLLSAYTWRTYHGIQVPDECAVTWADQDQPWLAVTLDDIAFNVDVSEYIRQRGI